MGKQTQSLRERKSWGGGPSAAATYLAPARRLKVTRKNSLKKKGNPGERGHLRGKRQSEVKKVNVAGGQQI